MNCFFKFKVPLFQRMTCGIHNDFLNCIVLLKMNEISMIFFRLLVIFNWDFAFKVFFVFLATKPKEENSRIKQFLKRKTTISSSYYILEDWRYRCESFKPLFKWRGIWNYQEQFFGWESGDEDIKERLKCKPQIIDR